jgi:predicted transcriptional regulator
MESVDVYRCEECDDFVLMSEEASKKGCCGGGLQSVEEEEIEAEVKTPESEEVLGDMFGLGETSLNVCFCVIDNNGATVSEVAEEMDIDRSAISRHMNRLVDTGILRKREKNLRQGGVVHVYTHEDPELVKKRLKLGAYFWTSKTIELINELNDEKMEAMMDEETDVAEALGGKIWQKS